MFPRIQPLQFDALEFQLGKHRVQPDHLIEYAFGLDTQVH
ncbi:hypothetical protein ALQ65_200150 [Pseudomonas syringae pv. coriandricola]|uniref:Uncharacterized protein n=1 Tax=Pseudomonas syringae pv. coriandricola TaxID=264453 RepID=A0A3M3J6J2_9PSED|nr:hypothetical protein ALQ65_200150 [Pseudomonas syringae pv. coriandricola]